MLPHEAVTEWKAIYKRETGLDITIEEASTQANRMFLFLQTITKQKSCTKLESNKGGEKNDKKTNGQRVRKY